MSDPAVRWRGRRPTERISVAERFKVGDRVGRSSEAGRVSGAILRIHAWDVDDKGHTHHASPEAPQYKIKSGKTDHTAMHLGGALTRLRN